MVHDIIGKVADKWTMLILGALHEHGTLRFTQLGKAVGHISQKSHQSEDADTDSSPGGAGRLGASEGAPVIPPHVDYVLTPLGERLGAAFCGVWIWAETPYAEIRCAREAFAARQVSSGGGGG